jgi:hypothetical protein
MGTSTAQRQLASILRLAGIDKFAGVLTDDWTLPRAPALLISRQCGRTTRQLDMPSALRSRRAPCA